MTWIDQFHKSLNAPVPYPTMLLSEQKCAHFCSEWSIVEYGTCAFWDLWIRSILICYQFMVLEIDTKRILVCQMNGTVNSWLMYRNRIKHVHWMTVSVIHLMCYNWFRNNVFPTSIWCSDSMWIWIQTGATVLLLSCVMLTQTDPRPAVRPAEGPNSLHWKNVKLEVLSCCTKFHEPHVVL